MSTFLCMQSCQMFADVCSVCTIWIIIKLSVNLNLHTARLPTPGINDEIINRLHSIHRHIQKIHKFQKFHKFRVSVQITIIMQTPMNKILANPRERYVMCPSLLESNLFNFMHFLGKNSQNHRLAHPSLGLAPPSGIKEKIRHCNR